jgi:hypothetical protein
MDIPSTPAAISASFTGSALKGLITASIFFTAPKLKLAYQMAIQMIESGKLVFTQSEPTHMASLLQFFA